MWDQDQATLTNERRKRQVFGLFAGNATIWTFYKSISPVSVPMPVPGSFCLLLLLSFELLNEIGRKPTLSWPPPPYFFYTFYTPYHLDRISEIWSQWVPNFALDVSKSTNITSHKKEERLGASAQLYHSSNASSEIDLRKKMLAMRRCK